MTILTYEELPKLREKYKDKKIVFCSGVFDLTHAGHIIFFEDCKKQGDILVVSVGSDALVKDYKGSKRPVLNENVRLKTIDSLKPVDYVVLDRAKKWESIEQISGPIFDLLKPDIYVINEDALRIDERKKVAEKFGVKMLILKRWCPKEFGNISTSGIIEKVKLL